MTDDEEDDVAFMERIARLNRMHFADWRVGERLLVSPLGAQVWLTPPITSDSFLDRPVALLDPNEEIIYLSPVCEPLQSGGYRWHKVLTHLGVVFVQKFALAEPKADKNE